MTSSNTNHQKRCIKTVVVTEDDMDLISRMGYDKKRHILGWKDWETYKRSKEEGFVIKYPRLCEICGNRLKNRDTYFSHVVSVHGVTGVAI